MPRRLSCPLLAATASNMTPAGLLLYGPRSCASMEADMVCWTVVELMVFPQPFMFGFHFSKTGTVPTFVGFVLPQIDNYPLKGKCKVRRRKQECFFC